MSGVGLPAGISSCTSAIALQASGDLSRSRRMLQFVLGWRAAGGLDPGSAGDALGAYPLFEAAAHGARWFSNAPAALSALAGARDLDPVALAGLLGGGWSLAGDPLWAAVRRLARGTVLRLRAGAGGEEECDRVELLPDEQVVALLGAGFDPAAAADRLVTGLRALAD